MHYAVTKRTVPKGVDDRLVTVKDPDVLTYSETELRALQAAITDPNYRIFATAKPSPFSTATASCAGPTSRRSSRSLMSTTRIMRSTSVRSWRKRVLP